MVYPHTASLATSLSREMQNIYSFLFTKYYKEQAKGSARYYHDCLRGLDYYVAPFPTWPKFMTVITRTSLTLDRPAAEGFLEFHHRDFKSKIENIFGKYL